MLFEVDQIGRRFESPAGGFTTVLDGISFSVEPGTSLAVVGNSGSGKSTLLNIMGALDRPTSGRVLLEGDELYQRTDAELAAVRNSSIGIVFQLHHLLPQCTALENVLLPTLAHGRQDRSGSIKRATELLERVGLGERLGHRPGQLSGGECQRVAVARALINQPILLLADEPTGSLDGATATEVADLLVTLNRERGVALVVVTHSSELADRMGRCLRLDRGRISEAPKP